MLTFSCSLCLAQTVDRGTIARNSNSNAGATFTISAAATTTTGHCLPSTSPSLLSPVSLSSSFVSGTDSLSFSGLRVPLPTPNAICTRFHSPHAFPVPLPCRTLNSPSRHGFPSSRRCTHPARRPRACADLVRPSPASLLRYMHDLRPRLGYLDARARHRVLEALEVASAAHEGQKRKSGEPFIIHPIAVAAILADMRMDRDSIIAGLLHDTVEDTHVTLDELENLFGRDVRKIVEGETKFSKLATKVHGQASASAAAAAAAAAVPENLSLTGTHQQSNSGEDSPRSASADPSPTDSPSITGSRDAPKKLNGKINGFSSKIPQAHSVLSSKLSPTNSKTPYHEGGVGGFVWARELDQAKLEAERDKQADNLRSMFLAMTEDVRVIIVKLADRLHNMRTLEFMSPTKQKTISRETLEFFAPLAHRLGMRRIKSELEELSFRYLYPDEHRSMQNEVEALKRRARFEQHISSAEAVVRDILQNDAILHNMTRSVEVKGTTKELYSIYRRVLRGESLSSMLDIATLCVVVDLDPSVDSNQACYHVLGRLHGLWTPLPKRLKDYIAFPKPNGYQSLHTTVLLDRSHGFFPLEIQIRTAAMHRIAEEGIAAELFQSAFATIPNANPSLSPSTTSDGASKEESIAEANSELKRSENSRYRVELSNNCDAPVGSSMSASSSPSIPRGDDEWRRRTKGWLISIRQYIEEFTSSRDLVDAVRRDLLGNRVFVFTPKGRIVDLPIGSTPVDLAYAIHSDVGHAMIGAKINGRMAGLGYKLQNADVVKIITSNCSPGPSADLVAYAKTRTARQKIRQFLRARERENMMERGRAILADAARKRFEPEPSEVALVDIMPKLKPVLATVSELRHIRSVDELLIAICRGVKGSGQLSLQETVLTILRGRRQSVFGHAAKPLSRPDYSSSSANQILSGNEIRPASETSPSDDYRKNVSTREEPWVIELGSCCNPIRGDDITGVRLPQNQKAVVVHRAQCEHLSHSKVPGSPSLHIVKVRWIDESSTWDDGGDTSSAISLRHSHPVPNPSGSALMAGSTALSKPRQPGLIAVTARDCDGLLSYVTGIVAGMGKSIRRSFTDTDPHTLTATLAFEVLVEDVNVLRNIINQLRDCDEVFSVRRIGPNEGKDFFPSSSRYRCMSDNRQSQGQADLVEVVPANEVPSSTESSVAKDDDIVSEDVASVDKRGASYSPVGTRVNDNTSSSDC